MNPDDPVVLDLEFERRLNARDLDGLMQLYEAEAALMPMPGSVVVGAAAVRSALGGFIAANPAIRTRGRLVARTGDLALLANDWTLEVDGPDGKRTTMTGNAIEVARRQPDGRWLFALDMPFGAPK